MSRSRGRLGVMRVACALLALAYLLLASNLFFAALDVLAPRRIAVASAAFPCAGHHCACAEAGFCAEHCCCYPDGPPPAPVATPRAESPATIPLSHLDDARCTGHAAARATLARIVQDVPRPALRGETLSLVATRTPEPSPAPARAFLDPPGKVPI